MEKKKLLYRFLIGRISRTWGGMQGVRFTQGLYTQHRRNKSFLFFPWHQLNVCETGKHIDKYSASSPFTHLSSRYIQSHLGGIEDQFQTSMLQWMSQQSESHNFLGFQCICYVYTLLQLVKYPTALCPKNVCMCAKSLQSCPTLCNPTHQAPLSMEFSSPEYWSGLSCPPLNLKKKQSKKKKCIAKVYYPSSEPSGSYNHFCWGRVLPPH